VALSFHYRPSGVYYVQAITKRVNKIGLKDAYRQNNDTKDNVHCLLGLPLLSPSDITVAVDDITQAVNDSDSDDQEQMTNTENSSTHADPVQTPSSSGTNSYNTYNC
jgi:hypothetical protein